MANQLFYPHIFFNRRQINQSEAIRPLKLHQKEECKNKELLKEKAEFETCTTAVKVEGGSGEIQVSGIVCSNGVKLLNLILRLAGRTGSRTGQFLEWICCTQKQLCMQQLLYIYNPPIACSKR